MKVGNVGLKEIQILGKNRELLASITDENIVEKNGIRIVCVHNESERMRPQINAKVKIDTQSFDELSEKIIRLNKAVAEVMALANDMTTTAIPIKYEVISLD